MKRDMSKLTDPELQEKFFRDARKGVSKESEEIKIVSVLDGLKKAGSRVNQSLGKVSVMVARLFKYRIVLVEVKK